MFDLEQSISEWRKQMLAAGIKSPALLEELEIHLREEIERQIKSGLSERSAFEISTQRIGRPEILGTEFKKNERTLIKKLDGITRTGKQTHQTNTMKKQIHFFFLTGWLIPVGVALIFFGRWITEIVIPTLKGGNFDQLYDLHHVRYLDTTLACIVMAFAWAAFAVFRWARRHINAA